MLTLYSVCAIVGGAFVILAAVAGIDGPDFDMGFDTDLALSVPRKEETEDSIFPQKRSRKLFLWPLTRFKFWTFGSCFFGMTGLLLSQLYPVLPSSAVLIFSVAVGMTFGTAIAVLLQRLHDNQSNSLISPNDFIGLFGTVEIPFDRHSKGKVRVSVKGANLDLVALTDSAKDFTRGEQICIIGIEKNKVWVVEREALFREQ